MFIEEINFKSVNFSKSWERLLLKALTFLKAESVNFWER